MNRLLIIVLLMCGGVWATTRPATFAYTDWKWCAPIVLPTSNGTTTQTLSISKLSGMNSNLSDIRFALSNGTKLPFAIVDRFVDPFIVWVTTPSALSNGDTIWMYYGKQNAVDEQNPEDVGIVTVSCGNSSRMPINHPKYSDITIDDTLTYEAYPCFLKSLKYPGRTYMFYMWWSNNSHAMINAKVLMKCGFTNKTLTSSDSVFYDSAWDFGDTSVTTQYNPAILPNGEVISFLNGSTETIYIGAQWKDSTTGLYKYGIGKSVDDGHNWQRIWVDSIFAPSNCFSRGRFELVPSGRITWGVYINGYNVYSLATDDTFKTFKKSLIMLNDGGLPTETCFMQLKTNGKYRGRIKADIRTERGDYAHYASYSDDEGTTWSNPTQIVTPSQVQYGNRGWPSYYTRSVDGKAIYFVTGFYTGYLWKSTNEDTTWIRCSEFTLGNNTESLYPQLVDFGNYGITAWCSNRTSGGSGLFIAPIRYDTLSILYSTGYPSYTLYNDSFVNVVSGGAMYGSINKTFNGSVSPIIFSMKIRCSSVVKYFGIVRDSAGVTKATDNIKIDLLNQYYYFTKNSYALDRTTLNRLDYSGSWRNVDIIWTPDSMAVRVDGITKARRDSTNNFTGKIFYDATVTGGNYFDFAFCGVRQLPTNETVSSVGLPIKINTEFCRRCQ